MCRLCQTRRLVERIDRQLKNIADGGAISIDAVREVLTAARNDLTGHHNAGQALLALMQADASIELVELPPAPADGGGHLH